MMAALKNWSDGDFLYGADMDDLATSLVMRFATKTARDNTLVGDLAPKAGMMAYTDDDKQTRQYVKPAAVGYWAPLPGAVVAELYQTVAHGVASGTYTPLTMQNFRIDRGYGALSNNSRWTPNVPGYYTVLANFAIGPVATTTATAAVGKNGVTQVGSYTQASTQATLSTALPSMPVTLYANGTGDYFEAYGRLSSGGTINTVTGGVACALNAIYSGQ